MDTKTLCENTEVAESKSSNFETIDRMLKLPTIETAWQQSQDIYGKVKNSNSLLNWAFSTTEGAIQKTAAVAAPLVQKLDGPMHLVDRTLVKGIDKLETSAPIIKEPPQQIYEQTKSRITQYLKKSNDKGDDQTEVAEDNAEPTETEQN